VAIPIGIVTALKRDTAVDYAGTVVAVLGVSMPGFLLGILLILVLSVNLRWLPASGFRGSALASIPSAIASGDPSIFWNSFRYFILPSISLAFVLVAINARLVRSSMIEVLQQDYITFARAKGLPTRVIYLRHALRNALLPVLTVVGLQLGSLLSGTIVIETVFAWPGIGRLAVVRLPQPGGRHSLPVGRSEGPSWLTRPISLRSSRRAASASRGRTRSPARTRRPRPPSRSKRQAPASVWRSGAARRA
jgi:ABC-type dipeptide/oligopeptide/nickel transport system permease component